MDYLVGGDTRYQHRYAEPPFTVADGVDRYSSGSGPGGLVQQLLARPSVARSVRDYDTRI